MAYAPGGVYSGLCLSVASGPSQNKPVTLQPCGVSADSLWIVDTAGANGGYTPLISGDDAKYPAPYVLTANTAGGNLTTQALKTTPGAAAEAQRWKATLFGVPAGNYVFNGYVTNPASATDVKADWTVPTLQNCGLTEIAERAEAPEWIGLGGVNTAGSDVNAPLVQIGTQEFCGYLPNAVYQIRPEMSTPMYIQLCGLVCGIVLPGDKMTAEVQYRGGNQYYISITDSSLDWTWSKTVTQPDSSITPQTADWIEEDTGALADFGTFKFTNCAWNNGTGLGPLTSANGYEGADYWGGVLQTSVSAISQNGGSNFTIKWLNS
jgi:hypothetical protein